jgi:predicted metalloprotease
MQPKEYNKLVATEIEKYWKPILAQNHKEYSEDTKV